MTRAWSATAKVVTLSLILTGCGDAPAEGQSADSSANRASDESLQASLLAEAPPVQDAPTTVSVIELGFNAGDVEAPVYVVEFSDYGCGYCRKFHLETYPDIVKDFIEEGTVGWKFIPFVSGMFENSMAALSAAECAGEQEMFRPMSDRLFQDQPDWKPADDPEPFFRSYAEDLGLDVDQWQGCRENDRRRDRMVSSIRAAQQLGVRATPTFYVDGYPVQGALPMELWRQVFEAQLGEGESN